jgi:hypothetical protein
MGASPQNSALEAAASSLRARKLFNPPRRTPRLLKSLFKANESKETGFELSLQKKAAEWSGVAGVFCCHSLHRSQMSKHL